MKFINYAAMVLLLALGDCWLHAGEALAGVLYYHYDHLGSTRIMSSVVANVSVEIDYYPYGETFSETDVSLTQHKYTGQENDTETGLYYYNARFYNGALGKFISTDPIVPDHHSPQSLNRYAYVYNRPTGYTDPTGHAGMEDVPGLAVDLKNIEEAEGFWENLVAYGAFGVDLGLTALDPTFIPAFAGPVVRVSGLVGKKSGRIIADLGTGPKFESSMAIALKNKESQVIAVDNVIELAKANENIPPNLLLYQGKGSDLIVDLSEWIGNPRICDKVVSINLGPDEGLLSLGIERGTGLPMTLWNDIVRSGIDDVLGLTKPGGEALFIFYPGAISGGMKPRLLDLTDQGLIVPLGDATSMKLVEDLGVNKFMHGRVAEGFEVP